MAASPPKGEGLIMADWAMCPDLHPELSMLYHICNDRRWFASFRPFRSDSEKTQYTKHCPLPVPLLGIGKVVLPTRPPRNCGKPKNPQGKLILENVLYAPEFPVNMIWASNSFTKTYALAPDDPEGRGYQRCIIKNTAQGQNMAYGKPVAYSASWGSSDEPHTPPAKLHRLRVGTLLVKFDNELRHVLEIEQKDSDEHQAMLEQAFPDKKDQLAQSQQRLHACKKVKVVPNGYKSDKATRKQAEAVVVDEEQAGKNRGRLTRYLKAFNANFKPGVKEADEMQPQPKRARSKQYSETALNEQELVSPGEEAQ